MRGQRYTVAQLEALRESPLVQKPDDLPNMEQWTRLGHQEPVAELRAERPVMINAGTMGNFGRRTSTQPEETVLGPPKLAFTSASRVARPAKAAEGAEKRVAAPADGDVADRFAPRARGERWIRDREVDGTREKTNYANGRRTGREEGGEGWTNVKGRKSLGQDDFDRGFGRAGDREREKPLKEIDNENTDAPARRAGTAARDKFDRERWGRRDEAPAKENDSNKFSAAAQGGWRDRERDRDRDRGGDRDWSRGDRDNRGGIEEDPEWMETRPGKEKKQAHSQEEFQRWKEQMRAKDAPPAEKAEPKIDIPAAVENSVPTMLSVNTPSKLAVTPSAMSSNMSGGFFGNWAESKTVDLQSPAAETSAKPVKVVKKSKFMDLQMFGGKAQESAFANLSSVPTPASPAPQQSANGGDDADKQGFQRILQMLGNTNINSPQESSQQAIAAAINGGKQGGLFDVFQQQQQQSSPQPQGRRENRIPPHQQVPRTLEQQTMMDNILAPRPSGPEHRPSQTRLNSYSSENVMYEQFGRPEPSQRPDSRVGDDSPYPQPPQRGSSAHEAQLQAIMNSRALQQEASRDRDRDANASKERDFLLKLMQSRGPSQQLLNQNHGMSFFEQNTPRPQPRPKPHGAPPGFMDESRFIDEGEMRRREQMRQANLMEQISRQQREEAMRVKSVHLPMGFNPSHPNHDESMLANLQRRNTAGEIPRQMTNMGIPSQPVPDMPMFAGRAPGMPPTPQERPNVAPPPGFGVPAGMRQPPGLGGLNGPQPIASFSAGNTPLGHPPGFGPPPGNMRGMFPGAPGQNQMAPQGPPQGPPQGYFPPPNYGPPMGMRGDDPRMMMGRPEFDQYGGPGGPGGPGPRPSGRPPNMY